MIVMKAVRLVVVRLCVVSITTHTSMSALLYAKMLKSKSKEPVLPHLPW